MAQGVAARDVQHEYGPVGNRQVVTDNGVPVTYTVNSMNQYTTVGGEPLSYDANGNLTSAPGLSLQYDSWNRLISAATESNLVLFAYDGRHRCVKRVEIQNGIGRTTIMIWGHEPSQGWGLLEERGANGELLARHVHGPSVDDLVLSELNGAVYYYHHDHLNSTIAVTDESGNVVEQYRYDVYGQPFFYGPDGTPRNGSALGIRFLFTGREWLSSLYVYDYRYRVYFPTLGRFLQADPVQTLFNPFDYTYAFNNVDNLVDPYGAIPLAELWRHMARLMRILQTEDDDDPPRDCENAKSKQRRAQTASWSSDWLKLTARTQWIRTLLGWVKARLRPEGFTGGAETVIGTGTTVIRGGLLSAQSLSLTVSYKEVLDTVTEMGRPFSTSSVERLEQGLDALQRRANRVVQQNISTLE